MGYSNWPSDFGFGILRLVFGNICSPFSTCSPPSRCPRKLLVESFLIFPSRKGWMQTRPLDENLQDSGSFPKQQLGAGEYAQVPENRQELVWKTGSSATE